MPRLFQRLSDVSMRKRRTSRDSGATHRRTMTDPFPHNECAVAAPTVPNDSDSPDTCQPFGRVAILPPSISPRQISSSNLTNNAVTGPNAHRLPHAIGASLSHHHLPKPTKAYIQLP